MRLHKAFSLIEVLVVIGIIALLSLVSIPSFIGYQKNARLKSESRLMAINIRLAQQYAITEQVIYYFKVYPGENSNYYQIINSSNSEVIKSVNLDPEIRISQVESLTDNTIRYTATGGVIETGTIYLANTDNITSTIQIRPSGYVNISD